MISAGNIAVLQNRIPAGIYIKPLQGPDIMTFLKRPVTLGKPDLKGRGLVTAIAVSAWLLALLRLRGYWRVCRLLGRYFHAQDTCDIPFIKDALYRVKLAALILDTGVRRFQARQSGGKARWPISFF